jgi:hypothetical protein
VESGRGYARFFFNTACKGLDTVFDYARSKFKNVFPGGKSDRQNTPQASYQYIVGRGVDDRQRQVYMLAENDPTRVEGFMRLPLVEYYGILDNKLEQLKKAEDARKQRTSIH